MIVGIGIDVVELSRIRRILSRHGAHFLDHILAPEEKTNLPLVEDSHFNEVQIAYVAGRFAAKEAIAKAMGTGFTRGIRFVDLIVLSQPSGAPRAICRGKAEDVLRALDDPILHVSLSHGRDTAVAMAILEINPAKYY